MAQQEAAEKRPPGKEQEADPNPNTSSSLSVPPRPDQARRRPWRPQRAQDSGSQTVKSIRINRVPLRRAESSSPSTTSQAAARLSQDIALVSSSSSFSCQQQRLKRGYPEGATEPRTPDSPPAKRRRIGHVPARSAGASSASMAIQVLSRLCQDTLPAKGLADPYRPQWLFPSSMMDNRSQPGPVRTRHVWRQQRRAKKPYSRPGNQSRARQAPAPAARTPHPSK